MAKTARGLAAHAKAQLGQLYWYGTFGNKPTQDLLDQKRKQYPNQMTAARYDYAKKNHVGKAKRVFDCAGLVKSYWMMDGPDSSPKYLAAYDKSAAGLKAACPETGKIAGGNSAALPEEPGLLLFGGKSHGGVYLGGDKVKEARGFDYGVVETKRKDRPWDAWGRLGWLEKEQTEEESFCQCQCSCCVKMRRDGLH